MAHHRDNNPHGTTPYGLHVLQYQEGCGSSICEGVTRRVFARGTVPCDVLFIGEAPGESENIIGRPFVGPAGKLLDHIIKQSLPTGLTFALTNLVCCIPREEDGTNKATEPPDDAILDCQQRLSEFIELCSPKLLVCVGALARDYFDPKYKHALKHARTIPCIDITRPAAVLRASVVHKGLMIQKAVVAIRNAVIQLQEE